MTGFAECLNDLGENGSHPAREIWSHLQNGGDDRRTDWWAVRVVRLIIYRVPNPSIPGRGLRGDYEVRGKHTV